MLSWLIVISFLFVFFGCTGHFQVDLSKDREANMAEDLTYLTPSEPVDLPDPLTLDDAVKIGLKTNLDIRVDRMMEEIADEDALSEKLEMLPNLKYSGRVYDSDRSSASDEDRYRRSANLAFSWNILDFGLSYYRSRQASAQVEMRRLERLHQAQTLALDIASAYWKAVLAREGLEQINGIEAEISEYHERSKALVEQKRLDPFAAKAVERKLAELHITANNLRADIAGAKIDLCRLLGIGFRAELNVAGESHAEYLEKLPEPDSIDSANLEKVSLRSRPDLFSSDLQIRIRIDEAKSALISMFPGISFDVTEYYDSNSYYVNNYWTVWGASVTGGLLSLPSQYVNWRAKKKTVSLAKLERLVLTAGIISQAHMALNDYMFKKNQFELKDDLYNIERELVDMNRERHQLGVFSDLALATLVLDTMMTKIERDRHLVELFNSYNMLLVTIGLDYGRWGVDLADIDVEKPSGESVGQAERDADAADTHQGGFEKIGATRVDTGHSKRSEAPDYISKRKQFSKFFYINQVEGGNYV